MTKPRSNKPGEPSHLPVIASPTSPPATLKGLCNARLTLHLSLRGALVRKPRYSSQRVSQRDEAIPPVSCRASHKGALAALLILAILLAGCAPSLHDTVARRDAEAVRAMLDADPALIMSRNDMGKTPLHYAVTYASIDIIPLLIEKGADVNAADESGLTPLHVAAMLDRVDEAKALLGKGADVQAKDAFGDTPLHTAALFGTGRMTELLIVNGADLTARNNNQSTPLECARSQRKDNIAERISNLAHVSRPQ